MKIKRETVYKPGHKDYNLHDIIRHSCAHLMAAAVQSLWPKTLFGIGPTTEDGFYYDFQLPLKITNEDLQKIEAEMRKIQQLNLAFIRKEIAVAEALLEAKTANQKFKKELINDLSKVEKAVSIYSLGKFSDLCKGPHVASTDEIGPFKLLSVAGAYWKGDEKKPMLTRIYGTCFSNKKELDQYLWQREEAKKRDHKKLGQQLDLFVINDNIGKGLPLLTPKGTAIRKQILDFEYALEIANGFMPVTTPHIAKSQLYKKTGHWQHYRELMYESFGIEGEEYVLKPMNCPHHYMIYASKKRSYRDLPMRLSEPGTCYRYEKTGELSGLIRVRALTIDDSHILMTEDQIEAEFKLCIQIVQKMFEAFSLKDYYVRLSLPDPSNAIKYIAESEMWDKAKKKLEKIVKDNHLPYKIAKGEASFYGPKLDYIVKDAIGREWQMSTLQLDLFMGKRLNLTYTDHQGKEKHPVILHRGLTGSIERTLAILIEHFAGNFPLWLSPVQVIMIPIADRHHQLANQIAKILQENNIRVSVDLRTEKMQAKIRDATLQKVPFMGIIGDKEISQSDNVPIQQLTENNLYLSIRTREGEDLGQMTLGKFLLKLKVAIEKKH